MAPRRPREDSLVQWTGMLTASASVLLSEAGKGAASGAPSVSLLIASKLIGGGRGLAPAVLRRAGRVALDWDTRQKSRFEAVDSAGRRVGVFLPRGRTVRGGD